MTPREAAAILRQHNEWRRHDDDGDDMPAQVHPFLIGEALDIAAEYIESREYTKP